MNQPQLAGSAEEMNRVLTIRKLWKSLGEGMSGCKKIRELRGGETLEIHDSRFWVL